jgi:parallel beta-helix repeat protein
MSRRTVSAVIIAMLLTGILTVAFNVQQVKSGYTWTQTIYIRADGSIDPPTAPISSVDNVTYTLTDNIAAGSVPPNTSSIIIQRDNIIIDGADHTLQSTAASNSKGINLTGRSNVTIKNMNITAFWDGIYLESSDNNSVSGNNITANTDCGIMLCSSSDNNSVSGNNITANISYGIYLYSSSNNSVSGNNITSNGWDIYLYSSSDNNSISGNNITANNDYGIVLVSSSNNAIYHNDFMNKTTPAYSSGPTNAWDDGYPSSGNYWSGYSGTDSYSGSHQDEAGSDGIGDTPYIIGPNNTDHYPLMGPFASATMAGTNSTVFPTDDVGLIFANVTSAGSTVVNETTSGPSPPPGRKMIGPCYNITTSASYSGKVEIRIIYDATNMTQDSARLRMLELMDWNGSSWINITTSVDIASHVIYGESTHLSPHGITSVLIDDVSITNVVPQKTIAHQGETLGITVSVWNTGDFQEDFSMTLYANETINSGPIPLGTLQVTGMQVGAQSDLTFTWNTVSFPPDDYTIWAHLYSSEIDNVYVYGIVQIIGGGGGGGRMPHCS